MDLLSHLSIGIDPNKLSDEQMTAAIAGGVVGGVVLVVAIVLLSVKKIRTKIFPYRDRTHFESSKATVK